MSKSRREKVTLNDGESYVVAEVEFWEHLISIYEDFFEDTGDTSWLNAATFIRKQVDANAYWEIEDDDEWA